MRRNRRRNRNGLHILLALMITLTMVFGLAGPAFAAGEEAAADAAQEASVQAPAYDLDSLPSDAYAADEVIVKFKDSVRENKIADTLSAQSSSVKDTRKRTNARLIKVPPGKTVVEMVKTLSKDPNVEYAEPNFRGELCMIPNDPYYDDYQWNLHGYDVVDEGGINMPAAWDIETGHDSVIVAVLDSGVAYERYSDTARQYEFYQATDLAGTNFWTNTDEIADNGVDDDNNGEIDDRTGWDFTPMWPDPDDAHPNDEYGHGTFVAGIIAATTNSQPPLIPEGCAGVAFDCTIMPIRIALDVLWCFEWDVADGIEYATNNGAKVINLSLSLPFGGQDLEDACAYAHSQGVTIVAATGNNGDGSVRAPASYDDYVIAVGASTKQKERWSDSNYGSSLDLVAPAGVPTDFQDIYMQSFKLPWSLDDHDYSQSNMEWGWRVGTSLAAPQVSGVAALLISHGVTDPDDVRAILQSTARDLGATGWDEETGWGLLDAGAALKLSEIGGAVHLAATQDGYMDDDNKDYNYGASTYLMVNEDSTRGKDRSVVQFDLSGIPANVKIVRAKMNLMLIDGYYGTLKTPIGAFRVTSDWQEGSGDGVLNSPTTNGVTYNSRRYGQAWTSSGGDYASQAYDAVAVGSVHDAWCSWDITQLAQEWYQGTYANYGVMLKGLGFGSLWEKFYSSEGEGLLGPYLEVTYITAGTEVHRVTQDDAYLNDSASQQNYNYGRATYLMVGNNTSTNYYDRSVVKCDLSGIPTGATIVRASLRLDCYDDLGWQKGTAIGAYRVTNSWLEGTSSGAPNSSSINGVTYNSRWYGQAWSSVGGDYASPPVSTVWVQGKNSWYSWDITSLVQAWVSGAQSNYGLLLKGEGDDYYRKFRSSEYSTAAYRPYVEIVYYT